MDAAADTPVAPPPTRFPVWDAHSCVPLRPDMDLSVLERHRAAGVRFVSVNVGMDMNPVTDILRVLAAFRRQIEDAADRFLLAETVADVRRARSDGRLAVAFDLEGALPLAEQPEMIRLYQRLGVRQMHLAYNRTNSIAGGCHENRVVSLPQLVDQRVQHDIGWSCKTEIDSINIMLSEDRQPADQRQDVGPFVGSVAVEHVNGDQFRLRQQAGRPAVTITNQQGRHRRPVDCA